MTVRPALAGIVVGLLVSGQSTHVSAQAADTYKARLGVVPVDATTQPTISGSGTVTAVLKGSRLSVAGTFSGRQSPATIARIGKLAA